MFKDSNEGLREEGRSKREEECFMEFKNVKEGRKEEKSDKKMELRQRGKIDR